MANRLADQTSPYLLQHKDNPVAWQPWDEQALARARELDLPLLVSIGYSACHWCHVMEHESFEDEQTAAYMNEHFVCIKVDREERPDVDAIYMGAVQAITGHGGWPLNVFCDPDGVPFYGGTYFPPEPRSGMPSFLQVLEGVVEAWNERREEIRESATKTAERLAASTRLQPAAGSLGSETLDEAERGLALQFDSNFGGFGGAPKFPPSSALEFLMARVATGIAGDQQRCLQMIEKTLTSMAHGGIYDQVGGGFSRYAVDGQWLVPHFEKMLYDNALLARCYLHAWQMTGNEYFRRICTETLDWALREMRGPEGGFYSALDADSEGVEGKFYTWSEQELRALLGDQADPLLTYWGVDRGPNFEGRNILFVAGDAELDIERLESARNVLYDVRAKRVWPGLDDKCLTSWNALMIAALADAGSTLDRSDYLEAARRCAEFVLTQLRDSDGRLLRTYKDGKATLNAYLEDHAFLCEALLKLYEATFDVRWFREAEKLADAMLSRFGDPGGGFFTTSNDHEQLVMRPKDIEDHPIPSGNSSAALALLRLTAFTANHEWSDQAEQLFAQLHIAASRHPQAFGHLLQAMLLSLLPAREVALVGEDLGDFRAVFNSVLRPTTVLAGMAPGDSEAQRFVPLLRDRQPVDGKPTAYVCQNFACRLPITNPDALSAELAGE